jgi:hypothetical protein
MTVAEASVLVLSNQPLEQTAHPTGFWGLPQSRQGWAAAHRQRWTTNHQRPTAWFLAKCYTLAREVLYL